MALFVSRLDSAAEGVKAYFTPDFHKACQPKVLLAALGQSFFSLSLGGTSMLVYGSYLSQQASTASSACLKSTLLIACINTEELSGVEMKY